MLWLALKFLIEFNYVVFILDNIKSILLLLLLLFFLNGGCIKKLKLIKIRVNKFKITSNEWGITALNQHMKL